MKKYVSGKNKASKLELVLVLMCELVWIKLIGFGEVVVVGA